MNENQWTGRLGHTSGVEISGEGARRWLSEAEQAEILDELTSGEGQDDEVVLGEGDEDEWSELWQVKRREMEERQSEGSA